MKARDIIPGWPRGRSTSRPMRYNRKIAAFFVTDRFFINEAPFFDHGRAALEWADMAIEADENQAEERRKGAMMDEYYVTEATWRETGKPDHCPECFNDGRRRKRLAVYQQQGYWIIRCFECFSLWQQNPLPFPDNIVHLVKRGSEVVWPEVILP